MCHRINAETCPGQCLLPLLQLRPRNNMTAVTTSEKLVIDQKWRKLPLILLALGALFGLIGLFVNTKQFAYSYLLAFMFFLSICLGGMFMILLHHLFDANWTAPIRRICEHIAFLLPVMGALFIPIALFALRDANHRGGDFLLYQWLTDDPHLDHALHAKQPIFQIGWFIGIAIALFAIWTWLSWNLRRWSLRQDVTGAAECTFALRKYAAGGIYIFAITLTIAAIFWVKSLEHQWFSTMYGVYYFAGSVWVTLCTLYLLTLFLQRTGSLSGVVHKKTFHDLGVLLFAFTVFYAYIAFSQYFLIWNASIPEETFWYVQREKGSWWDIGMILIFGHFALPFLALLRIDAKLNLAVMVPLCIWGWIMHYCDMAFNIMPKINPDNFRLNWTDLACLAFFAGVLSLVFIKYFKNHAPYPVKDPRLGESLGVHHAGARPPIAAPQ
jgi:hypothetical protein